jgi:hypothetical protein
VVYSLCEMKISFALVLAVVFGVAAGTHSQEPADQDYSGQYSFLREGEFIQISIEDGKKVTGFISRYGDTGSDHGVFLDQFLKPGTLAGGKLVFSTEAVHGTWFEFDGVATRGPAKSASEEGFYLIRGKLTRFNTDAEKKNTSQVRQVEFRSFPHDVPGK